MRLITRFATIFLTFTILALCLEANAASTNASATSQKPAPAASDWRRKWDDTVTAAKKEGELVIYLNAPVEARITLSEAFSKKFGMNLNAISGSGAELGSRLNSEYQAGVHHVDAFLAGAIPGMAAKAQGFLEPLLPMLILPDVNSTKAWFGQRLPMFDRDGMILAYFQQVSPAVVYNTGLVKDGQIMSYLDLLKPEWKGKMVMFDPTIPGAANFWAAGITQELGVEKVNEFLSTLIKQQEIVVTRDMGQQIEWVTRGKYPLAIFPQAPAVAQYLKSGAPLAAAAFKEFSGITASNGGLAVPKYPPHPNAAIVFINWFLSREGQTIAVRTMGAPSTRLDVPPEGVNSMFVLQPGQKFFLQTEELIQNIAKWIDGWKKIFAQTRG